MDTDMRVLLSLVIIKQSIEDHDDAVISYINTEIETMIEMLIDGEKAS